MSIDIEQVKNGYIVTQTGKGTEIFKTTDELFEDLLLRFEGRSEGFGGQCYGKVWITRNDK